jgi:hypothetical protein
MYLALQNACLFLNRNFVKANRITLRLIFDACEILIPTLTKLFYKIYYQNLIPDRWKLAKIVPIHKKVDKNKIENYRLVANLCCLSKLFEKLILRQINYLEKINNINLTGKQQPGIKKTKGQPWLAYFYNP